MVDVCYPVIYRFHLVFVGDHGAVHPARVAGLERGGLLAGGGALGEGRQAMCLSDEVLERTIGNLVRKDVGMGIEDQHFNKKKQLSVERLNITCFVKNWLFYIKEDLRRAMPRTHGVRNHT